jgi:hypothetical protein
MNHQYALRKTIVSDRESDITEKRRMGMKSIKGTKTK